ncbi:hypothetical protein JCM6882_007094 [Rhodosporidiobolus microsporus]
MDQLPPPVLLGTSSVPYSPLACSPSALVSNADGQYAIVTRGEVNIFTPALGYSTTAPVTGTSAPPPAGGAATAANGTAQAGSEGKVRAREELPLLRTIIPVEKKNVVKWHDWVDEYDALVPGADEAWWRSATWSPSGLSPLGGCVLATLTNNAEVLLFAPNKDAAKGEWNETCDVTSLLLEATIPEVTETHPEQTPRLRREAVASVRRCQTSTLAWSPAVPSSSIVDRSLLALGHRSGEVSLWRLAPNGTPSLAHRFRPTTNGDVNWINVLAWSTWTVSASPSSSSASPPQASATATASATLALADADGRVWSVEVVQTLGAEGSEVEVKEAVAVVEADKRGATQMCWIEREGSSPSATMQRQLAFSKLGTVSIGTLTPDPAARGGWKLDEPVHEVELRTEGAEGWMGATAWAPCSGLSCVPRTDSLLVSLSSSSLHSISLSPSSPPSYSPALSASLTSSARLLFDRVISRSKQRKERFASEAGGRMTRKEGGKVLGFVGVGGAGKGGLDVAYVYETERPSAFTHRTAAGTRTYLTVANLAGGEMSTDEALEELERLVELAGNARAECPLFRLQSLLLHLTNHASDASFVEALLQQLAATPIAAPLLPPDSREGTAERLLGRLFGVEELEKVRVREAVARALTKAKNLPQELQHAALTTHISLARQLIKEVLSRIAAAIGAVELSDAEKPLHARLLLASSSLLPPIDRSAAQAPSERDVLPPDALAQAYEQADELCPACTAQVPLANVRYACCVRGHQWERCSLTLAVVSSTQVRTCTACARKALLSLPPAQGGEVVNEVLKAATCCVYCGGRWMRVR